MVGHKLQDRRLKPLELTRFCSSVRLILIIDFISELGARTNFLIFYVNFYLLISGGIVVKRTLLIHFICICCFLFLSSLININPILQIPVP
jgi:hypothetical protein